MGAFMCSFMGYLTVIGIVVGALGGFVGLFGIAIERHDDPIYAWGIMQLALLSPAMPAHIREILRVHRLSRQRYIYRRQIKQQIIAAPIANRHLRVPTPMTHLSTLVLIVTFGLLLWMPEIIIRTTTERSAYSAAGVLLHMAWALLVWWLCARRLLQKIQYQALDDFTMALKRHRA